MTLSAEKAIESIHTMHVLIEKIFNGVSAEQDLTLLLEHFTENFEMVGAAGKKLKFEEVKQLFTDNKGKMPDIKIEIYDEKIISQNEQTIVLTYTEKHIKDSGVLVRHSCALIEEIQGKMLWRFLQETFTS